MSGVEWKVLPLDERIAQTYHLVGISFEGNIIIFGGDSSVSFSMYLINENGELVADLSLDLNIPGRMCQRGVITSKGKIYVVGNKQVKRVWVR